jgi:hypothetical protein
VVPRPAGGAEHLELAEELPVVPEDAVDGHCGPGPPAGPVDRVREDRRRDPEHGCERHLDPLRYGPDRTRDGIVHHDTRVGHARR